MIKYIATMQEFEELAWLTERMMSKDSSALTKSEAMRGIRDWKKEHEHYEPTCKNIFDEDPTTLHIDFVCSECYCNFNFDGPINFCSNCGARVIG